MVEASAAFDALVDLAQRSRSSAKGLPAQVDAKPTWSGIGFGVMGKFFVVPMGQASELLELPHYTRLPGVQTWVRGVSNVRGRLLPLIDLAMYFGERLVSQRKAQRVLVLENEEIYCGLIVDQAFGIQHFITENYRAENKDVDLPELSNFLKGSYPLPDRCWHVFSMLDLMADPRFLVAAKN
ncbi:chemotaxis protein CheW [Marinibactrum halimedae]|uniref:Protein PilI n=1 Tax=Marinibactrum halimedae TaxID=1444977 RepID=A0AA37T515_9GAMM|nr:chemotaxis protein CheW [Marinibactrum halimedae]MCD9458327.1 chemotaxis protein CheW [Marinibactrum halimedae]GLS27045.1 protein PilI [Marinibactrum halimedae]